MDQDLRQELQHEGYLHLRNAVPRVQVRRARQRINAWMGRGMPPEELERYAQQSACPEDRNHPDFLDLFYYSTLVGLTDAIFGRGALTPVSYAQIALRFPTDPDTPNHPLEPHLDGVPSPHNGVPADTLDPFAALVGIYLQDVVAPWSGNFTVWPGSHLDHAAYFAAHGPGALLGGLPPIDRRPPKQMIGRAGDAFLCHYLLAHSAAANTSPDIRYAVFFRLRLVVHDTLGTQPMVDPWLGWPGVAF